jgi:hypothetical protein
MSYAINYKQPQFAYHQDRSTFPFYLASDGKVMFTLDPVIYDPNAVIESIKSVTQKDYLTHGIVLYIAWFLLGFISLASKRYISSPHQLMQIIHSLSGYSILILTVVMSLVMIKKYGWKIKADLHPILGVIVLVAIFLVVMTGMIRMMLGKGM